MRLMIASLLLFAAFPALAEQPDAATLQRLLAAIEAQRNQALTQHAYAEAKAAALTDDLAKAKAQIKELETKGEEKPVKKEE